MTYTQAEMAAVISLVGMGLEEFTPLEVASAHTQQLLLSSNGIGVRDV